jgi:hypothetical protein
MEHHLTPKYLSRLAQLEQLHPPAFRFLSAVQKEDPAAGLWLSTATNAHLYKDHAFLMYIKVQGNKQDPTSIVLSSSYNNRILEDAIDHSAALFPRVIERAVMDHKGFSAGWARRAANGEIAIKANAPHTFFDALLNILHAVDVAPKDAPVS